MAESIKFPGVGGVLAGGLLGGEVGFQPGVCGVVVVGFCPGVGGCLMESYGAAHVWTWGFPALFRRSKVLECVFLNLGLRDFIVPQAGSVIRRLNIS